jgi:PRTRC genetic system protein A
VKKPIGYLYCDENGINGDCGLFYDYIVAANGVFIRAENPLLKATIRVAEGKLRGLHHLSPLIELKNGKIPGRLYHLAMATLFADRYREHYVAIAWNGLYSIEVPEQMGSECSLHYEKVPNTVLEFHSHGEMSAFFSGIDNTDELGLCLYVVVGRLDRLIPEVEMRVGVHGYFHKLSPMEVFIDV